MKVTYDPPAINNLHGRPAFSLVVSGERTTGVYSDNQVYRITRAQARRLQNYFCGIGSCRCRAGGIEPLNEAETSFGVRVDWCKEADHAD